MTEARNAPRPTVAELANTRAQAVLAGAERGSVAADRAAELKKLGGQIERA